MKKSPAIFSNRAAGLTIIIFIMLATLFSGQCRAEVHSLLVLPPKNNTGDARLEWLGVGLQDAVTSKLWNVEGVRTIPATDYLKPSGTSLSELGSYTPQQTSSLGSKMAVDTVWCGSYSRKTDAAIELELKGFEVGSARELFTVRLEYPEERLPFAAAELTAVALKAAGYHLSPPVRERVLSPTTASPIAFELNARGFNAQLNRVIKNRSGQSPLDTEWLDLLNKAVTEDPNYAEAWVNLGWAAYATGDIALADRSFSKAVALKPYLIDALMGEGYVLRKRRDSLGALKPFEQAVRLNPSLEWPTKEMSETIGTAWRGTNRPILTELARNSGRPVRLATIKAIASFKQKDYLPLLDELANDNDDEIGLSAITAMGTIGGDEAIPLLKKAYLKSPRKIDIINLLVKIKPSAARDELIDLLATHLAGTAVYPDATIVAVTTIMGNAKDKIFLDPLIQLLQKGTSATRSAAALALGDINLHGALPALKDSSEKDSSAITRASALIARRQLGDMESESLLVDLLNNTDASTQSFVISTIRKKSRFFKTTGLARFLKEKQR